MPGTQDRLSWMLQLAAIVEAAPERHGPGARVSMFVVGARGDADVWTFEAHDDRVELEDSVFLAGSDGPRRTAQIVIRQSLQRAGNVRWSFVRSSGGVAATVARRNAQREPELPLETPRHDSDFG